MQQPVYPPLQEPPPRLHTEEDRRAWEDALHKLALINHILQKAERIKLPVQNHRADCDNLCMLFQGLIAEFEGPQSPR
jgi:hypothetical protein